MNVTRWKFKDTLSADEYVVEVNPNQAGSLVFPRAIRFSSYGGGRMSGVQANREPLRWTFSGVVRSKSHHDELIRWQREYPGKVRVTDHLGRQVEAMIESLQMTERRALATNRWRFTYEFNLLVLRRIA